MGVIPGSRLQLSGGLAAWASMTAIIQQVSMDIDSGRTTITFGPPKHLGTEDLLGLLRSFRNGRSSISFLKRTTGKSKDTSTAVELSGPGPTPATSATTGPGGKADQSFVKSNGSYKAVIQNNPTDITKVDANVTIMAREVNAIDSGTVKKRQVMCSESYGDDLLVPVTVITAHRYDETTHQDQVKTRSISVIAAGSESEWTLITGGQLYPCT
jgi:hypothetical protein